MLQIEMLPARQGDCFWVSYGANSALHHLVIDGGPENARVLRASVVRKLQSAPGERLHIDLLVVTHIDNDHIGGVLDLLRDLPEGLSIGEVWFNAYRHLPPPNVLNVDQAEALSDILDDMVRKRELSWNAAFQGGAVMIPEVGDLPVITRQSGLKLTLLSPDRDQLAKLGIVWKNALEDNEEYKPDPANVLAYDDIWPPNIPLLAIADFLSDRKQANGSSIAFLMEYEGKRVLFAADAFPDRISASIDRIDGSRPLRLDAFKLSHHGSRKSSSSDLLRRVSCERYLISTDGSFFGHPDAEAMARILIHGGPNPLLIFNAETPSTKRWSDRDAMIGAPAFRTRYPDNADGISIILD